MKKLCLLFTFISMVFVVACTSESNTDSKVREIVNTPVAIVVPTVKPEITKSSTPTPFTTSTITQTPIVMKTMTSNETVKTQYEDQKSSVEIISNMKKMWDQGYSHHSILNMNMTVSFDDYLEDLPMLMEGDVQNSRTYKGVTSFEDNGQIEMIEMIVMDENTYAKYPNTKYWIQFPEDQKPVNPVSLIDLLNKNVLEGEFIGVEESGGNSSDHIALELESSILGELLPVLENSIGTLNLDFWVESDTYHVVRFLVNGMAVGGPRVKGPDGQEVTIKVNIEMSSWDFAKLVELSKPELPSTPEPMVWDASPEITLQDDKDYSAIIKIYGGGEIKIDLFEDKAPVTVNNFIFLSEEGYYDWVTFHRVIPEFMAQGGDPSGTGRGGPGYFIGNEFHPEARHDSAGVLSMANSGLLPDGQGTSGSQFFITYREAPFLDGLNQDGTPKDCASASCHSVFGRVVEGMDVLNNIVPRDPETASLPGDVIETIEIIAVPK